MEKVHIPTQNSQSYQSICQKVTQRMPPFTSNAYINIFTREVRTNRTMVAKISTLMKI